MSTLSYFIWADFYPYTVLRASKLEYKCRALQPLQNNIFHSENGGRNQEDPCTGLDLRTANFLFNPLVNLYLSACGMCSALMCAGEPCNNGLRQLNAQ